jgi:iron complex transport system permease protein
MKDKQKLMGLFIIALVMIALFILIGMDEQNWRYFLSRRGPKVIGLVLTGTAIAFSTVVFQTITNNRILTPSVMGLDSMYLFLQTVIVFMLGSSSPLIRNAQLNFILTTAAMIGLSLVLYRIILKKSKNNVLFLLLVGTVISTFFRSFSSFMQMVIDPNEFTIIQNQMFASFNHINSDILFATLLILLVLIPFVVDDLKTYDVCALGRDNAINLGINYDRLVKKSLIIIAILISVSTALVGPITFLGLLVANLAREMLKTFKHSYLLVTTILISVIFLVGGQFLVERILQFNTTLSVIINFIGGLYFIILLLKENRL